MTFPLEICIEVSIAIVLCLDLSPAPLMERNCFIQSSQKHCITDFQRTTWSPFHTLSLKFILEIFLKFLSISQKIYSYRKNSVGTVAIVFGHILSNFKRNDYGKAI